jgi:integrase/recombinase XerD
MILLDTDIRALELCSLKIGDIDQKTGRVEVKHGVGGGAKFKKGGDCELDIVPPPTLPG